MLDTVKAEAFGGRESAVVSNAEGIRTLITDNRARGTCLASRLRGPRSRCFRWAVLQSSTLRKWFSPRNLEDGPPHDYLQISASFSSPTVFRETLYGANNPITAETLSDLSLLYFYEEKPAEAVRYGRRALAIREQTLGKENLDVSTTLNRIGISERDLGQYSQAKTDLKRAPAIREKSLDRNHIWIAISLENLASVYIAQRDYARAAPLRARARAIRAHPAAG